MTSKEKKFCDEYLIDLNGTQAAIRAGYSEKTAGVIAFENLKKPYIQEFINNRQKVLQELIEVDQVWVLQQFKENHEAAKLKNKVSDSNKSLENIAKHLGFFEKDNSQKKIDINIPDWFDDKKL